MTGRVVIVTGANSGLGFETARRLCDGGNDVILACRNEGKGKDAVDKIIKANPNALATFMQLDLADMSSIRNFVDQFGATNKKLNVLVNNAGLFLNLKDTHRQFTKDNFELTMGTNYLGPFLLTHLLLDNLKTTGAETEDARIVFVASSVHDGTHKMFKKNPAANLDPEDLFLEKDGMYNAQQAYKNSKLAIVMATYQLAQVLEDSKVTVNCLCPGFIPSTELVRNAGSMKKFMLRYILGGMFRLMKVSRTLDQGVRAILDLISNETLKGVTGKYYVDMKEVRSSEESYDEEIQKKLWELSARYCHMEGYEPLDAPPPPPPTEETVEKTKTKKEVEPEEKAEEKEEIEADAQEKQKEENKQEEPETEVITKPKEEEKSEPEATPTEADAELEVKLEGAGEPEDLKKAAAVEPQQIAVEVTAS